MYRASCRWGAGCSFDAKIVKLGWYEGCPKSLASYFFKNRKMMLERYPAVVI